MDIAICLTGFIRNIDYIQNITYFYKNIFEQLNSDKLNKLTFFYSCPSKLEETCNDNFDKDNIISLFQKQETDKIKIKISFREYEKEVFVKKTESLNLPYITSSRYHSFRIVSCIYGFSETAKMINSIDKYNFIIFTRLDMINFIESISEIFDNTSILKNEAYVWRTIPYISCGDMSYHCEDRFLILSTECIDIFKDAYNKLDKLNIKEDRFGTEIILGILLNLYEHIEKKHLYNLIVSNEFNIYTQKRIAIKYTQLFLENM